MLQVFSSNTCTYWQCIRHQAIHRISVGGRQLRRKGFRQGLKLNGSALQFFDCLIPHAPKDAEQKGERNDQGVQKPGRSLKAREAGFDPRRP